MQLSKEIRDLIFKTPEIMRKFKFTYNYQGRCPLEFFIDRGTSIRNLRLNMRPDDEAIMRFLLNCTPNLEELTFFNAMDDKSDRWMSYSDNFIGIGKADLPRLKYLHMKISGLDYFIKNTKNVKNLQYLSIFSKRQEKCEMFKSFMDQQNNKNELNFTFRNQNSITNVEFLLPMAEYVTEFTNNARISDENLVLIFEKFKKLRKFTDNYQTSNILAQRLSATKLQLKSLKIYESKNNYFRNLHFEVFNKKFPNLEVLKCERFLVTEGINDKLETLHVCGMSFDNNQNFKLPNLKNFYLDFSSGKAQHLFWDKFYKNIENVENIEITGYISELIDENFLQNLKKFPKLKTFKFVNIRNVIARDFIIVDNSTKVLKISKDLDYKYKVNFREFKGIQIFEI